MIEYHLMLPPSPSAYGSAVTKDGGMPTGPCFLCLYNCQEFCFLVDCSLEPSLSAYTAMRACIGFHQRQFVRRLCSELGTATMEEKSSSSRKGHYYYLQLRLFSSHSICFSICFECSTRPITAN